MLLFRCSLLGLVLVVAGCSSSAPEASSSATSSRSLPSIGDAPLSVVDCGWPVDTEVAFQGWSTEADLGMMVSSPTAETLYWIVSAQPVPLVTSQGSATVRVACAVGSEGLLSFRTVADDWDPPAR